ncbi:MAG: hypothetical protein COT15_04700 [Candidatus Diapherotrites archaeon CG08_land_8_20_14_0_20_34_12]|nr:MAG: hypothetical protein COT15_04700 [Candidatus Diapherotrites archaeon CG08_land_8_20_14_0_20_34_12]
MSQLSREAKQAIYEAVENLVDYAHTNRIDTIVIGGAEAGPYYQLFRIIWGKKYKEKDPSYVSVGHVWKAETYRPLSDLIKEHMMKRGLDKKLKGRVMVFDESMVFGVTMASWHKALTELGAKPYCASLFSVPNPEHAFEQLPFKVHVAKKLMGDEGYFKELYDALRVSAKARGARRIKPVAGVNIPKELTRPKKRGKAFCN